MRGRTERTAGKALGGRRGGRKVQLEEGSGSFIGVGGSYIRIGGSFTGMGGSFIRIDGSFTKMGSFI